MNFGFGAGDVFTLVQLAWNTLDGARQACGEHDALTQEVASLHREISNPNSLLNRADDDRKEELEAHGRSCEEILNSMNEIVMKYNTLSEKGTSAKRVWQQVRFGNDEMRHLSKIRLRIATYTSALNMSLNLCSLGSQSRVERDLNSVGGDMKGIRATVDWIAANMAGDNGEGTVWTSYTNDERSFWRELRRELVKAGYRSSDLHRHKRLLTNYIEGFLIMCRMKIYLRLMEQKRVVLSGRNDEGWSSDEDVPSQAEDGPDQPRPKVEDRLPKQPTVTDKREHANDGDRPRRLRFSQRRALPVPDRHTHTPQTRNSRAERPPKKSFLFPISISFGVGLFGFNWGIPSKKLKTEQIKPVRRAKCSFCHLDDRPVSETFELSCHHRACLPCWCRWTRRLLKDPQYNPPKCCTNATNPFSREKIVFVVKEDSVYWDEKFQEFVAKTRIYCRSLRCGHRVRPVNHNEEDFNFEGKCIGCDMKVCMLCFGQHRANLSVRGFSTTFPILNAKLGGWQQCYNCKMLVSPQEGNNHTTCDCKAQFCMACGLEWKTCDCPVFPSVVELVIGDAT